MTEKEFLEKYGNQKVYFSSMYEYRAIYKNGTLNIWCSGVVQSRDDIRSQETVLTVFDLEYFRFGFISENDSIAEPDKTI
jgi:hypothetical protein